MAQADGNIANQTGAGFRADLNNQLLALFTQHSGNGAPVTTYAFQPWIDTSASPPLWKIRNSANTAWITIGTLDATFSIGGVTAIANGGTGQTTASGAINALVPSQTGNSGKALISNGTAVSWGSAGAASKVEIFTGSTTWTCPDGVTFVTATVVGGGGGGAAGGVGSFGGTGGVGIGCIAVAPGTSYTVTVGSGGAGTNSGTNNGSAGSNSTFSTITATGGNGGVAGAGSGNMATSGTCTSSDANLARGCSVKDIVIPFVTRIDTGGTADQIAYRRLKGGSRTAAVAWTADFSTSPFSPGSGGEGENSTTSSDNSAGGVGGIVMLQY